ncbi:hypothetical protein [Amycolatopsis sp. NPDC004079]|uniref:hypothetical protein n=1 Tax=Amycolatopsis sp. NPDC004079 TaxID=3154549 RepID=UPI0033B5B043
MPTVLDPAARRCVEDVRANLARALSDIDALAAGEASATDAVRTRLQTSIVDLDVLADEAVVTAWISCTGMFWSVRSVPWTALAETFTAVTGQNITRDGLDRQLKRLFAGAAPRRQAVAGRNAAAGYAATALWAAITHWHRRAGVPLPVSAWRTYSDVAAVLDLLPAIVQHRETAATGKQLLAAVRAAGGRVPRLCEPHVTELAREHRDAAHHWVAVVANA